jgi:glutamine synthetase
MAHAKHIKAKVLPLMTEVRGYGDEMQQQISAELWPMPGYRELLFLK